MSPAAIPESHLDLLDGPCCEVLTTIMPGGQPQSSFIRANSTSTGIFTRSNRSSAKHG